MNQITKTINKLLEEVWFEYWPNEINNGNCESFAHDVTKLVPSSHAIWAKDWFEINKINPPINLSLSYCFIMYRKKFFDSECPKGVKNIYDLPFFKNQKRRT